MHIRVISSAAAALTIILTVGCSPVADPSLHPEFNASTATRIPAKPSSSFNPNGNLYWGDIHIHTGLSAGAWFQGVRSTPNDAYTFARGGEIEHTAGYGIRIRRPLDFAAVTDHAEYLGFLQARDPDHALNNRSLRQRLLNDGRLSNTWTFFRSLTSSKIENYDLTGWERLSRAAWQETIDAAENHNLPGQFTTFIAYEWTSMPEARNLHRNVIYRGINVPELPFSAADSEDPRDLWTRLEKEREQGMDNFAIPHNGNLSDGTMFGETMFDGGPMNTKYAERRLRNEPLTEIFQIKGSAETHPDLSPKDTFAGFEIFDTVLSSDLRKSEPKGSYLRDALRLGLEMSHNEGFNPYRFGVIGSTDSHNSSSPIEEDNFHGKLPLLDGSAGIRLRASTFFPEEMQGGTNWSAAGLAAVWAEENTRDALYEAMQRKETYATSGSRIRVRFFGGWGLSENLLSDSDWLNEARIRAVPMGSQLPDNKNKSSGAPQFVVAAHRDPEGANLDRIQIVKAWVDESGQSFEKIFDVAWSGERTLDEESNKLPPIGNSVNLAEASYTNSIGTSALGVVWQDPEFSPENETFYYVRVLEIPTPRWSTYDAKRMGMKAPEPATIQERAVTSAIWYKGRQ
ncbi:MAG: DUF3604 domain-containing protein [Pseudomonadota bacterium]